MSPLRIAYLVLTIIGTILPMIYFIRWFQENGWSLTQMITVAWHANPATTGLTYDLTIAAITLTLFIIVESRVRKDFLPLIAIPATYCIGVSCGLPLYLLLRSRSLD
ncbi:DUF2834 domain-containing protein [Algicella marina]|uniref:DUF2834 domain-containing protein n=1 Tax=Algicella marina TaxID=2683284 RepID=A0A6P1T2A3_9RHOB|nr:DUF2834 domain-containing protein [Algicella marina]QHQ37054.1 DUF2834 domain-containing protein [Algicella marina]